MGLLSRLNLFFLDLTNQFLAKVAMRTHQTIKYVVNLIDMKRMPEAERKKPIDVPEQDLDKAQIGEAQYAWLFNTDMEKELEAMGRDSLMG